MVESLLQFLTDNRTIIVGATVTIAEVTTVVVNLLRKLKSEKEKMQTMGAGERESFAKKLIWSANPINLFRQP